MPEHEEIESSIAGWVLGAVDAQEADEIRIHVEGCVSCREMVSRMERAVGVLPLEVEEVQPPARLRSRVLAAAAAMREPGTRTAARPAPAVRPEPKPRPRPRITLGRTPAMALAAAVLLALVVGLVVGDLVGRSGVQQSQVARYTLTGHGDLAGAGATVINLKDDGVALVDFNGLPQLEAGKVYELWLISPSGHPDPALVFVPDSNGSKFVLVNRSLAGYTQMAITVEQGPDGAPAPTQQPQLYGSLA
jgi:anti-sigma-K factor RskA